MQEINLEQGYEILKNEKEEQDDIPLSVSELSLALKGFVEGTFKNVRVKGEVSGMKLASSGHLYLTLKDENAVLNAVCWRNIASKLPVKMEEGLEVICQGNITTYIRRSYYQITIQSIRLAGHGSLLAMLEKRKKELAKEGLFDPSRKKPLPKMPAKIGVVTSMTGAVIRDIVHRLKERSITNLAVWDVAVQGSSAAFEVSEAILGFNQMPVYQRPDLLIVARGGGSIEDLWAFNEEVVVRAVAESQIPIISAVGHETDTTLIDYASDRRAPTPTAAAEIAAPVKSDLERQVNKYGAALSNALPNLLKLKEGELERLSIRLKATSRRFDQHLLQVQNKTLRLTHGLRQLFATKKNQIEPLSRQLRPTLLSKLTEYHSLHLVQLTERMERAGRSQLDQSENKLLMLVKLISSYDYKATLKRGFSVIKKGSGQVVISAKDLRPQEAIEIEFFDGVQKAEIIPGKKQPPQIT